MYTATYLLSLLLVIPLLLTSLALLITPPLEKKEALASFECGFEPMTFLKFSSPRFFPITIIFLIFDIEISLLLPLYSTPIFLSSIWLNMTLLILLFLAVTTILEWFSLTLDWMT